MVKNIITILTLLILLTTSSFPVYSTSSSENSPAGAPYTPILVRIQTQEPQMLLSKDIEIVGGVPGVSVDVIIPRIRLAELDAANVEYSVLLWDVDAYNDAVRGQYHTLSEMENILLTIASTYPNITSLYSIGTTYEGRDIWCLEITDNPGVDEGEPGVFFMGLHHAREWPTVEICLYLADQLTSQYTIDPNVTDVVDNRRIWVVPCVNPDGYYYCHDLGNDWRKNRHYFPDYGTYGVDLNRNYGGSANGDIWGSWGSIHSATVTHKPSQEIYCGPWAFSELEAQAIRDVFIQNDICATVTWHTYSELVLWPWGYTASGHTPDDTYLAYVGQQIAQRITRQSGSGTYTPQQSSQLYPTTGDTTDWVYGYGHYVQGRATFPYTIEAGSSFHPSESYLDQICQENFDGAFYLLQEAENISNVIPRVIPPEINDLSYDADGDYTVSWVETNPSAAPDYFQLDELSGLTLITDDAESGSGLWMLDGFSLTSSQSHSPGNSYKSRYANQDCSAMTSLYPLPVTSGMNLSFWCWYKIEDDYDCAFVEVSRDGRSYDILDKFMGDSNGWVYKEYNLTDYTDESIYIRFRYTTDSYTLEDGFFVDDIHPVPDFTTVNTLSSSITDTFYDITDNPNGTYYYRVKGHNTAHGWGDFSTLEGIQVGQSGPTTHVSDLSSKWNFIALPFNNSLTKDNLFVRYNGVEYTWTDAVAAGIISDYLFGWDRNAQSYHFANTLEPGYGYWVYAYEACELKAPSMGTMFDGYITHVKQKWNIIGLPNDEPMNKTDITVTYLGMEYTWSDAVAAGIISDYIFNWDRTGQTYTFADTLEPGYSYWMYAFSECTLKNDQI